VLQKHSSSGQSILVLLTANYFYRPDEEKKTQVKIIFTTFCTKATASLHRLKHHWALKPIPAASRLPRHHQPHLGQMLQALC